MTLSPCRTLQNVIQTQKCVLCLEYAKPNRCVFKCFANVSKPKEEDLKSTGKAFQLLGPATAKDLKPQSVRWLGTTMSPWAADLKADRPGTKEVLVRIHIIHCSHLFVFCGISSICTVPVPVQFIHGARAMFVVVVMVMMIRMIMMMMSVD